MDVYEFSERDDQCFTKYKSVKQRKRKSRDVTLKANITSNKRQTKRRKLEIHNMENVADINPPIKLKLIRDQSNPNMFKSIQIINDTSQSDEFAIGIEFERNTLSRCKLSDAREFALNDVVWAKISGYPFWPSKILSLNLSTENFKSIKTASSQPCLSNSDFVDEFIACVEWLAYDQISYVNCSNLSHFQSDFINKYSAKIKNKKYFEAVNEARSLCDENLHRSCDYSANQQTVDSVHSCETSSSTLPPSHNFTSPESNQSTQSYCPRPPEGRSHPLSNQSDCHMDYPLIAHRSIVCTSTNIVASDWDLPDLGSNLDFESNNHIPEFSDYENDDCDDINIAKIEFMIDETHKV